MDVSVWMLTLDLLATVIGGYEPGAGSCVRSWRRSAGASAGGDMAARVVTTLLTAMDGLIGERQPGQLAWHGGMMQALHVD